MKYPKVSRLMKDQREYTRKTIYTLAEQVGVTASYLSQVENGNKLPSKKVMLKITHWLDKYFTPNNFSSSFLTAYARYKNLDPDNLIDEYANFRKDYADSITKEMKGTFESIAENKLKLDKVNLNDKGEILELPYFDLKWLLTQNKFEVFYDRQYDIQNAIDNELAHPRDRILYSRLNDEDIKIIHDIIEAYISNRYRKAHKKR